MITYKCSKRTIVFWLFVEVLNIWLTIHSYLKQNYADLLVGIAFVLIFPFWIYSLCRLKIVIGADGMKIEKCWRKVKNIHWKSIRSLNFPKYNIFGNPDIHFSVESSSSKNGQKEKLSRIIVSGSMEQYKYLLRNIVEKATKAEIDPKIKEYIAK